MKSSGKLNLLKNSSWTNVKDKSCITSRINYETLSNIICIEFELFRMFAHWIKHTGNFYRKCTWKYLKALLKCFNCNKNAWNFTYTRKEIKEKKKNQRETLRDHHQIIRNIQYISIITQYECNFCTRSPLCTKHCTKFDFLSDNFHIWHPIWILIKADLKRYNVRTVGSKIIRALAIILEIFLWFNCQFLLSHVFCKLYKA